MKVVCLEIQAFRGFKSFSLKPRGHVVLVGEPRSGKSDLIEAMRKVFDPDAVRRKPNLLEVHNPEELVIDDDGIVSSISVTITNLSNRTAQHLNDHLELIDLDTGLPSTGTKQASEQLGVRIVYVLHKNPLENQLEHWLEFPHSGTRLSYEHRKIISGFFIDSLQPLQLRPEGRFRELIEHGFSKDFSEDIQALRLNLDQMLQVVRSGIAVNSATNKVVNNGAFQLLGLVSEDVRFAVDDPSLAGVLRLVQPWIQLDDGPSLPILQHGSSLRSTFDATEALAIAQDEDRLIFGDDLGAFLGTAEAEFIASKLSARDGQVWITTRLPELAKYFRDADLVRLSTRPDRQKFQLPIVFDKARKSARRRVFSTLAPGLSSPMIVLVEGPHDADCFRWTQSALIRRSSHHHGLGASATIIPVSSLGAEGGGKSQLVKVAEIASQLGMRVRVVLDGDKPDEDQQLIEALKSVAEIVIRLPDRTAIERTLMVGVSPGEVRSALSAVLDEWGISHSVNEVEDDDLMKLSPKLLKLKGGLHTEYLDMLPGDRIPPLLEVVVTHAFGPHHGGQRLIQIEESAI